MRMLSQRGLVGLALSLAQGCSNCGGGDAGDAPPLDAGGADAAAPECTSDAFVCDGDVAIPCESDIEEPLDCGALSQHCDEHLGCVACEPYATSCSDGQATFCRPDGTLAHFECDPVQGLDCQPSGCEGACALSEVHDSYIGCDYYPTITLNPVWSGFSFAIAVANTHDTPTQVTVTRGEQTVIEQTIAAGALEVLELDWVAELKGGDRECKTPPPAGATRVVADGAYRLRSDQPVTVYQFSPLEYELSPAPADCPIDTMCGGTNTRCLSYSNDASLLLPATALTGNYTALAWPSQDVGAGFIAVTATEDVTQVRLTGQGAFVAGAGIDANGHGVVVLDRGDVLEVVAGEASDPSGTRIRANKPVQVIGGQSCALVPSVDVDDCDHIEEGMLPEETLGSDYVVTAPLFADMSTRMPFVLRMSAIEADTQVTFDPPIHEPVALDTGLPFELALSGDAIKDVHVTSDHPLLVALYMEGNSAVPVSATSGLGDPSLSVAVPIEQYRRSYLVTAPTTYAVNIGDIVAPAGTRVTVDGELVDSAAFTPIGESGFGVAHVRLEGDSSVHTVEADAEVGLTVYGYGSYTSYMYPGGADLERITIPPIL